MIKNWIEKLKNGYQKLYQNQLFRRIAGAVCSIILLCTLVGVGWTVGYNSVDPSTRTVRWVVSMVKEHYYQEFSDEEITKAMIQGTLFNGLLDQYSTYYSKSELGEQQQEDAGNLIGIGVSFARQGEKYYFNRISGNSPAESAGLRSGMRFFGYGLSQEEMTMGYGGFAEFVSLRAENEPFYLLAGETDEVENAAYFKLSRQAFAQNYVYYSDADGGFCYTGENATSLTACAAQYSPLAEDVAIIKLTAFDGMAANQMKGAFEIFKNKGKTKLVLDLRQNGGGQLKIMGEILQYLCKDAPERNFDIASYEGRNGYSGKFQARENRYGDYFAGVTVSVLADSGTASASEALIGAMIDYGTLEFSDVYLSEFNGEARSYGKGIMQTTYSHPFTGEGVKLTTATVHWPKSGRCIHGEGITPALGAIAVESPYFVGLNDPMLEKVLTLI